MGSLRVPDVVPTPTQDAKTLEQAFEGLSLTGFFKRKFMDGIGTDGKGLIGVLGHRNASQRKQIAETYHQLYNKTLIDRISGELYGDFRKAVIWWTYDPAERDARLIEEVLKKKTINDKSLRVIVEVACASSPHHLAAVRKTYCSLFDCSIEEDIEAEIPSRYKKDGAAKLLVALVSSFRCDKEIVDSEAADRDCNRLEHSISRKELDDHFVSILSVRNFYQLRATFDKYEDKYGRSILQDLTNCGSVCMESLLNMAVSCIASPERYFAEVIKTSIKGLGTDEDSLTRAIVSRAEVDMKFVKEEYVNMYKCTVKDDVAGDTSGNYKAFLLTLTGDKF